MFFFSGGGARRSQRKLEKNNKRGGGPDKNKPLVLWMWMTARREGSTSNVRTERRWAAEEKRRGKKQ